VECGGFEVGEGIRDNSGMRFGLIFFFLANLVYGQTELQQRIKTIAVDAHGKVSVSCALPDSSINCDLDARAHPPMQSVFKAPLALTALHLVEQGTFSLDQPIRFLKSDRILPHTYSPLQDRYPEAGADIPLRELLRLAVSLSDNVAADIVLRAVGGPTVVDAYIQSIGVTGFHLEDGEDGLHREVAAQYRNWFEPAGAVQFLRRISDNSPVTSEHTQLLLEWMKDAPTGAQRIKGELPAGTIVMHKTGTSGTDNGVTHATNDIGLITLPDGRRLAIALFVTDSAADDATRDAVIARIAKAAYEECLRTGR
jgi:beta-lactamase class A